MPSMQSQLDLDRVLSTIDVPAAVVILVNEDNTMETAATGIDNAQALFEVVWSLAVQMAAEVYENFTPEQRAGMKVVLPTEEDARKLGILKAPFGRRQK